MSMSETHGTDTLDHFFSNHHNNSFCSNENYMDGKVDDTPSSAPASYDNLSTIADYSMSSIQPSLSDLSHYFDSLGWKGSLPLCTPISEFAIVYDPDRSHKSDGKRNTEEKYDISVDNWEVEDCDDDMDCTLRMPSSYNVPPLPTKACYKPVKAPFRKGFHDITMKKRQQSHLTTSEKDEQRTNHRKNSVLRLLNCIQQGLNTVSEHRSSYLTLHRPQRKPEDAILVTATQRNYPDVDVDDSSLSSTFSKDSLGYEDLEYDTVGAPLKFDLNCLPSISDLHPHNRVSPNNEISKVKSNLKTSNHRPAEDQQQRTTKIPLRSNLTRQISSSALPVRKTWNDNATGNPIRRSERRVSCSNSTADYKDIQPKHMEQPKNQTPPTELKSLDDFLNVYKNIIEMEGEEASIGW